MKRATIMKKMVIILLSNTILFLINSIKQEKNVENEIFEGLRNEISEKINLCTERETEISQILIELQDIVCYLL